jgi:CheY-like chemotaxis protein
MSDTKARVLDVGQCGPDHSQITRLLQTVADARADAADSMTAALEAARSGGYDLILVNRVFDATGESGLDLIARLRDDAATKNTPVMLVSNHADAQEAAGRLGALPGFGKAALGAPGTAERLRGVLAAKASKTD